MPSLLLSPVAASLEVPHGACAPSVLWPPTPSPRAGPLSLEADALQSDAARWLLLLSVAQHGSSADQGPVPPRFDSEEGLHVVARAARGSVLFGEHLHRPVKVKNTFIDGFLDDEDQCDGPAMTGCKSWCVGTAVTAFTRQGSASSSCASTSDEECLLATAPPSPDSSAVPVLPAEPPSPPPSPPPSSAARRPQVSAGADLHGTGRCRPCGWFWKPEGCAHGAECCHCHMCPEGELKARKKSKFAALRARNHTGSSQGSQ